MSLLSRRLVTDDDVEIFQTSKTYDDIVEFIEALNSAVMGKELGEHPPVSPAVQELVRVLDQIDQLRLERPAAPSSSRFGKPEFVGFLDSVQQRLPSLLEPLTTNVEPVQYLGESFGNKQRIDYGSGHELNFMCCLLTLKKLDVFTSADHANLVTMVLAKYLRSMRAIQETYWLEPAGSHGVWGLDDYHFLPYLFGSGQLVGDPFVRPMSIHDADIVDMYKDTNLYFWSIAFINRVKTSSLRWHSPMLDDISGVKKWAKVNEGMLKMYKAEVLGKLPIIQHFLFGDVLPAPEGITPADAVSDEVHLHCWADCCGIRIPSAIAASGKSEPVGHTLRKSAAVPVD